MEKIEVAILNYTGSGKVKAELYLGSGVVKYTEENPAKFTTLQTLKSTGFTVIEYVKEPEPVKEPEAVKEPEVKEEPIALPRSEKSKKTKKKE